MIGTPMKIVMNDGTEHLVPVTLQAACEFEDHYKIGLLKAMTEDQKLSQIAYLAYCSLKSSGAVVKLFPGWIALVQDVSFQFEKNDDTPGKERTP